MIATTGGVVALLSHAGEVESPARDQHLSRAGHQHRRLVRRGRGRRRVWSSLAAFHPEAALVIAGVLLVLGLIGVYFAFRRSAAGAPGSRAWRERRGQPGDREQCRLMARVIVIGAGLAGLASAVRLAKLGHQVTICERRRPPRRRPRPGRGRRLQLGRGSSQYDAAGRAARPVPQDPAGRSRAWSNWIRSPIRAGTSSATARSWTCRSPTARAQVSRVVRIWPARRRPQQWTDWSTATARPGRSCARRRWSRRCTDQLPAQRVARAQAVAVPRPGRAAQSGRRTSARGTAVLRDPAGSDAKLTPGYVGVWSYLERTFGRWTFAGRVRRHSLDALAQAGWSSARSRSGLGTEVVGVDTTGGVVTGVRLADGSVLPADIVVSDIDPRELYGHLVDDPAAKKVRRRVLATHQAESAYVVHLGLRDPVPELAVRDRAARRPDRADSDRRPGTSRAPGVVGAGARLSHRRRDGPAGRPRPAHPGQGRDAGRPRRSWWAGVAWEGYRTAGRRAANVSPIKGLYCVGAGAHPGAGVPATTLGAAIVADAVGKA